MKNCSLFFLFAFFLFLNSFTQSSNLEFSFSGIDSISNIQLDSVKVINRSQGGETMLYWPDTTISMTISTGDTMLFIGYTTDDPVGIENPFHNESQFQLLQNYPNPVSDHCKISVHIPTNGQADIMISDLQGSIVYSNSNYLERGKHDFRFFPGKSQIYFFRLDWEGMSSSIKILSTQQSFRQQCILEYIGITKVDFKEKHFVVSDEIKTIK